MLRPSSAPTSSSSHAFYDEKIHSDLCSLFKSRVLISSNLSDTQDLGVQLLYRIPLLAVWCFCCCSPMAELLQKLAVFFPVTALTVSLMSVFTLITGKGNCLPGVSDRLLSSFMIILRTLRPYKYPFPCGTSSL